MNPDFIEIYDNVLTSKRCNEIIDFINSQDLHRAQYSDKGYRPDVNDSWGVLAYLNEYTFYNTIIAGALKKCVDKYLTTHPQLFRTFYQWGPDVKYNLQKYDPGQCYHKVHCENDGLRFSSRVLVWMIYLNTVTEGGGTYFENYDRTTDAVEGRVVLWPPYWTHCHKGVVSNTEEKYIATGWFECQ